MTKQFLALMFGALLLSAGVSPAGIPAAPEPGTKVPAFTLKDASGNSHSLSDYADAKYVAIMFIATQCPVSNAYNERMVKLYDDFSNKGVVFLGINSNRQESVEEIKEHSADHGFKFPVLKDVDNAIADAYGAAVTPEIYVVDGKGMLRYHGRIDDSRDVDDVTTSDLRITLDALLAGKDVSQKVTKAFGCSIKRVKKS